MATWTLGAQAICRANWTPLLVGAPRVHGTSGFVAPRVHDQGAPRVHAEACGKPKFRHDSSLLGRADSEKGPKGTRKVAQFGLWGRVAARCVSAFGSRT